jgi:AraC-like DNA-binding protein
MDEPFTGDERQDRMEPAAFRLPDAEPGRPPGYREFPPPASLRGALTCLWTQVIPADGAPPTLVLPDGCTDLYWCSDGSSYVAGPDTGPAPVQLPAGSVIVGARFRPGAGGALLGVPLSELLNTRVETWQLGIIRGGSLTGFGSPRSAFCQLVRVVSELRAERLPDRLVVRATALLAWPDARAEAVAGQLGVSERQLRRRFHAGVGYGPRTLQRVLRFRRFVSAIDAGLPRGDLAQLAAEAGYADQPHLTRECVRLSGLSPAQLTIAREHPA